MPEMLVVIGVIVTLMAVGFPAYRHLQERGKIKATESLIGSVAAVLAGQPLTAQVPSRSASGRPTPDAIMVNIALWDVNGDGLLDGNVAVGAASTGTDALQRSDRFHGPPAALAYTARFASDADFSAAITAAKYSGFVHTTGFQAAAKAINARGQLIDAWGTPLRYIYAPLLRSGAGTGIDTAFLADASRDSATAAINARQAAIAGEVGGTRFGVWSAGPDRQDGTSDDIATFP